MQRWSLFFIIALSMNVLLPRSILCGDKKSSQEEGRFDIYVADKEVGQEKFSIVHSSNSISSNSTTNFRDPGNKQGSVKIETQLKMDGQYMPQSYEVHAEVGGRKQAIKGTFISNKKGLLVTNAVVFEYLAGGSPIRNPLMVGDSYAILDTNVFHHYIFAARLFDFHGGAKTRSVQVVIPQEIDTGVLKITDVGTEQVSLRGKNRELHHLKADSGSVQIDLWIDEEHVLHKIALPSKRIEAIRH
jgi:hypothetical protein